VATGLDFPPRDSWLGGAGGRDRVKFNYGRKGLGHDIGKGAMVQKPTVAGRVDLVERLPPKQAT